MHRTSFVVTAAAVSIAFASATQAAYQVANNTTLVESFDGWLSEPVNRGTLDLGLSNYLVTATNATTPYGGTYTRTSYTNANGNFSLRDSVAATDRAFGAKIGSSGNQSTLVFQFENTSPQAITGFSLSYEVVQMSVGGRATKVSSGFRFGGSTYNPVIGATDVLATTANADGGLSSTLKTSRSGGIANSLLLSGSTGEIRFVITTGVQAAGGTTSNAHVGVSNFMFTPIFDNVAPTVTIAPESTEVVVSPSGPQSFGPVLVSAVDADAAQGGTIASFVAGAIPSQIADNLIITPGPSNTFTISGSGFVHADMGTYLIPFTATDNIGVSTTQNFTLSVVPEPTTLLLFAGAPVLLRRRRR